MFNKSLLCKTANHFARTMTRREAFKAAWKLIKGNAIGKVAGVTRGDRQAIIANLSHRDNVNIRLERERDNIFDSNAIAIIAEEGGKSYKMGYIPARTALLIAPILDTGISVKTALKAIVGGYFGMNYGLRVSMQIAG